MSTTILTNGLTPTQKRMLDLLMDGMPHRPRELRRCLYDNGADVALSNVKSHISNIRKYLRRKGLDVVCNQSNGTYYIVRRISRDD